MDIKEILNEEEVQIKKMDELVNMAIEDEHFLTRKLHEVENDDDATFGQRVSDNVADFGGSWTFILGFSFFLVLWVIYNAYRGSQAFDPFPFILLNLILSCLAALQAPIIMMSQNRQEEKDRRRARSDYMINLKAEMEIRTLHDKLDAFEKSHKELIAKILKDEKK
ncbi:DUF1003 domain-containing protein [Bacteriovorax stolpii]|uniref:Cyclic nucleotide-binding protein n=1 Tax=Bacteriovorax stolpii TaxID=960 RepID=A0A2K9NPQ3_BACTC|nr:DUF1003 domain-containing protein [Bacteriovorax stolpii]AUN97501.1 cyclic nucleotide-binding protein [Bacteriovorax stolpii]QDK42527.1 DUF1003 domain-containing protein [Bacteriovorax stolpii]TDP52680.1 putative membrane protein [Bacteriovorax stolpii]